MRRPETGVRSNFTTINMINMIPTRKNWHGVTIMTYLIAVEQDSIYAQLKHQQYPN